MECDVTVEVGRQVAAARMHGERATTQAGCGTAGQTLQPAPHLLHTFQMQSMRWMGQLKLRVPLILRLQMHALVATWP